jgi:hypothetical protein
MSTMVDTKMTDHTAVEFWGGADRGVCLQITASCMRIHDNTIDQVQEEGYIQLTMEEAAALCNDLGSFVRREALRRQDLLRRELEDAKIAERMVFREVANLPADLMAGPELAVLTISRYCPRTLNRASVPTTQQENAL